MCAACCQTTCCAAPSSSSPTRQGAATPGQPRMCPSASPSLPRRLPVLLQGAQELGVFCGCCRLQPTTCFTISMLQLPQKMDYVVFCELSAAQLAAYK